MTRSLFFPVHREHEDFISLLSAAQVETLRYVFEHKNSKEIARIMNISPHTVDERIRRSIKKLNVSSRIEAAQTLARHGVFDNVTPYQPLIYQPSNVSEDSDTPDEGGGRRKLQQLFDIGLPFPTASQPTNRHGLLERIVWPILIALATILAFSALYAILIGFGRVMT